MVKTAQLEPTAFACQSVTRHYRCGIPYQSLLTAVTNGVWYMWYLYCHLKGFAKYSRMRAQIVKRNNTLERHLRLENTNNQYIHISLGSLMQR